MNIFLDTNVWIDFLAERHPHYISAAALFTLADEGLCRFVVSSLTMVNAHYVCCERGNMPLALWKQKVASLSDLVMVGSVGAEEIADASNSDWSDYEDSVQYFAAKRSGCQLIVTRNVKDFQRSDIRVLTPDQAIDLLLLDAGA